ncbi:terminase [Tunturiibacter lichenicola]|uniref:terminase n=1 Tax=Tunturiibacter lichenicola TaxID=2051959 RepID=UPI0021B34D26|nr:terminase [Edaphobacter lichenicola]
MGKAPMDVEELLMLGKYMELQPAALRHVAEGLLRVRDREGVERPLRANAVQREFERRRGRQNIVLKARQMGITTWVAGRFFLKTITARGVMTVQVAQTREAAEGIFRMVQRFWECLPVELREGPLRRSRANAGQMCFPELDSEFRVVSAADESAGRGLTVQYLHCSEVSRWPGDAGAALAGLRAALVPGGEMVMESTPNGAYGCFYEEWGRGVELGVGGSDCLSDDVVRHFFPWWMEEAYVGAPVGDLREDERRLVSAHGLTAEQIGFRRGLEMSYRGLRSQEFAEDAESCFKATGECCFEVSTVEARLAELGGPVETRRGGALQVWLPPIAGKEYVVAVDTAGGGADGDFAAVQVIEMGSGMQCAELQQRLGTLELARVSAELAREYGGATIAVERNNHGAGVLAYLDSVERYARVYGQAGVAGWLTTAGSKPGMVSRMGALLVESPGMFFSRRLLGECRTFVAMAGGRTGAVNGAHDDCLMAMAIAQAVRAELVGKKR